MPKKAIHSEFFLSREDILTAKKISAYFRRKRDSNRQRCYQWEFDHLRPTAGTYKNRQAAKGYARLCAKVAIKELLRLNIIQNSDTLEYVRKSFKAAITKEEHPLCLGCRCGVYIAKWGWSDVVIAHEVAHWADQWAHGLSAPAGTFTSYEAHGPKWRGWFAFILSNTSKNFELDTITLSLKMRRLEVSLPAGF